MEPLTEEQIYFVMKQMERWICIRERDENLRDKPVTFADPTHSGLLFRLLSGKDPLPFPPPCNGSRPDYDLATGAKIKVNSFSDGDYGLHINSDYYEWVDRPHDLCRHPKSGMLFKITREMKDFHIPGEDITTARMERFIQMLDVKPLEADHS